MRQRRFPGIAISLLLVVCGADAVTAQGKVGYRGHGRYAGAKPTPVAPTPTVDLSSRSTPGPGIPYGVPPTDYRVDPYASLYGDIPAQPRRHHGDRPHDRSQDGPYVIPYYVPIYLPAQPAVYERPREEETYFAPEPEERPAPAPVVVVVQAPGGSIPAVGEILGSRPPAASATELAAPPLPHPTTPEPPKAPAPGRIELSVQPPEATIYLDDRYLGTAAEVAAKGGSLRVDSGVHVLQVLHPAHKPERMVFGVASGGGVKVEVDLSGQRLIRRSHFEALGKTAPLVEFGG